MAEELIAAVEDNSADDQDEESNGPGGDGMALRGFGVVLDGKAEQSDADLPEMLGAFARGIGFSLLADFFDLVKGDKFARFGRELLRRGGIGFGGNGGEFMGIEPEELAAFTEIERNFHTIGCGREFDFHHGLEARRTVSGDGFSRGLNALPESVDGGRISATTQERQTHGVAAAGGTFPVVGTDTLNVAQANIAMRTMEHAV